MDRNGRVRDFAGDLAQNIMNLMQDAQIPDAPTGVTVNLNLRTGSAVIRLRTERTLYVPSFNRERQEAENVRS